jgi:hypothetical protein
MSMVPARTRYLVVCAGALVLPAAVAMAFPALRPQGPGFVAVACALWLVCVTWVLAPQARLAGGWLKLSPLRLLLVAVGVILALTLFAAIGLMLAALLQMQHPPG